MKVRAVFTLWILISFLMTGCQILSRDNPEPADTANSPVEKYWKLVELYGQPVPVLKKEPYLILKAEGNRVNGFGGCNGFNGSYQIDESLARISFGQLASTRMACPGSMDTEQALLKALGSADNYSMDDRYLTLNRARMAPLARFEVVYLR